MSLGVGWRGGGGGGDGDGLGTPGMGCLWDWN